MNIDNIIAKSIDCHMKLTYERIIAGNLIGADGSPIPIESYTNMIKYFERFEEYEMCAELLKRKRKRFDHQNNFHRLPPT